MVGGLGLITASNFYLPQVNVPGSMGTFILPAAVPVPAPAHRCDYRDSRRAVA